MRPSDLEAVMLIERRSFSAPWAENTFRGLMRRPSAVLLAAEVEGAVVGYSVAWFAADEAELGDIAVHPDARGRGIGEALLQRTLQEAAERGASFLYLEVREANHEARRLYAKAGFEVVGLRKDYYSEPVEDAIVMRLELHDSAR